MSRWRMGVERFAGRFSLVRELGTGGMGEVSLALDHTSGTECALKRLSLHLPMAARVTLKREFEVLTRLRHPAIVAVHEFGFSAEGRAWITMEYVPGRKAHEAVSGLGLEALYEVAAQVADGLDALHGAGLVHGDVKPSNLLVVPGGAEGSAPALVKLVDFGLSALLGRDKEGHRGTTGYAPPEVVAGSSLSVASDYYSFGVTLFVLAVEALSGPEVKRPVEAPLDAADAALRLATLPLPGAFTEAVLRLLVADPRLRPTSLDALRGVLERLQGRPRHALDSRLQTEQVVGRSREWVRLERWLTPDEAHRVLLVEAESGMGKSTLLRALAARATLAAHPVIALHALPGSEPGELVRRLLLRLAAVAEARGPLPAAHSAIREQLERGSLHTGPALEGFMQAGSEWLEGFAGQKPVVILIDDLDQADALSRAMVRRMASMASAPARWLWAGGAQLAAEGGPEALLVQAGWAERMPLGALSRLETEALIVARLRRAAPPALVDYLWDRCGGHPGMTVELLRQIASANVLVETAAGLEWDPDALQQISAPVDFAAACLQRLRRRGAAVQRAAEVIAVWDAPLDPAWLAHFGIEDPPQVVDELRASGLLGRDDDERVLLQPPVLRNLVREQMDAGARAAIGRVALELPGVTAEQRFRLWRAVGEPARALDEAETAFATQAGVALALSAAELTEQSRLPERAAIWHGRIGREWFSQGRLREAVPHLQRALELPSNDPERERWIAELANCYSRLGRRPELAEFNARMLATPVGPLCRVGLLMTEIARHFDEGRIPASEECRREADRVAQASGDPEARGMADLARAFAEMRSSQDGGEAIAYAQRALDAFRKAQNIRGELRAIGALASAYWQAQRGQEALPILSEGTARARAHGQRIPLTELLLARVQILVQTGDWSDAVTVQAEVLRLCMEEGLQSSLAVSLVWRGLLLALTGENEAALRLGIRAGRLCRLYAESWRALAYRNIALAARNCGRFRLSTRAHARALALHDEHSTAVITEWLRLEHGQMLAWRGRWQPALEVWESALREYRTPDLLEWVLTTLQCARARLRLDRDRTEARRLRDAVEPWCRERQQPLALAHAAQFDAEWHLLEGRVEATIETARRCLEAFDRLPDPADSAHAALAFARLGLESPIAPRLPIAEWLDHAVSGFRRLGDRASRMEALERLFDLHRRFGGGPRKPLRDRELLQRVGRLIESMSDFDELAKAAMRLAVNELDAERGVLLLAPSDSDDEADLEAIVEHGAIDDETRGEALGYSRKAVRMMRESGQPLVIRDAATELEGRSRSVVELGVRSILCVPLLHEGQLIGAVYLDDRRRSQAFGRIEQDQLVSFAGLLAVAIQRSRGHDAMQRENQQLLGENLALRRAASQRLRPGNFIGSSLAMQRTLAIVERAARSERTVLITGENGTGKELIAQMIHHTGPRAGKPFIEVNCGAIGGELMESELFGIEDHVATGVHRRPGFFRAANGGTLFLDEIGEMTPAGQVALLRVLAERTVRPLGGSKVVPVDVRVIAATNRDLPEHIESGAFRRDLFFRLNVIPIEVPPLRERRADIPSLAQHFVARVAAADSREVPTLSPALLEALMQSEWPGNVRELENYIERLMTLQSERVLVPDPLPADLQRRANGGPTLYHARTLPEMVDELERRQVEEALERTGWHQSRAAAELGLTEQSIRYRIKKFGLLSPRR